MIEEMRNGDSIFDLNDTILERIIFAMEDQTRSKAIDLRTGELVEMPGEMTDVYLAPPPVWSPADGFRMMETFCSKLKNIEIKRSLMKALSHGKGVFKAFRTVLAEYPQEEIQFRLFKNNYLKRHVEAWMDDMRESVGFARLGPEPEDFEELVDEVFKVEAVPLEDIARKMAPLIDEATLDSTACLPAPVAFLEKKELLAYMDLHRSAGIAFHVCDEGGSTIAIAVGYSLLSEGRPVMVVRFLHVNREFRTAGLELRLLEKVKEWCGGKGIEHILLHSLFLHPELASALEARGACALGSQFLL